jgi:hypothetical protein
VQHSARETEYFLERIFPRAERLVAPDQAVLLRDDSGFDSARLLFAKVQEKDRWAAMGRSLDFITKWNPRCQDKADWMAKAEEALSLCGDAPGQAGGRAVPGCGTGLG